MRWGGELAHVQPDLGDDDLGGVTADPGDLVQAVHHRQGRGQDLTGFGVDGAGRRPGRLAGCLDRRAGAAARAGAGGCAAGIAAIVCSILLVSWSIWPLRASIWSSSILASSA